MKKKGFVYRFSHDVKAMIALLFVIIEIICVVILPVAQNLDPDTVYSDAAESLLSCRDTF